MAGHVGPVEGWHCSSLGIYQMVIVVSSGVSCEACLDALESPPKTDAKLSDSDRPYKYRIIEPTRSLFCKHALGILEVNDVEVSYEPSTLNSQTYEAEETVSRNVSSADRKS
ncbi:unnamed protein product [Musa acuminata var. zebrina]